MGCQKFILRQGALVTVYPSWFIRVLATFLQHFKGSRLSLEEVAQRARSLDDKGRAAAFLTVLGPIFERYRETLARAGEIDFHDMINRVTEHVEAGRYRSPFGYILVDEFQDISPARARLLKALLDSAPGAQLFAVTGVPTATRGKAAAWNGREGVARLEFQAAANRNHVGRCGPRPIQRDARDDGPMRWRG